MSKAPPLPEGATKTGRATLEYAEEDGEACWRIVMYDDKEKCVMHAKLTYTPRHFPMAVIAEAMLKASKQPSVWLDPKRDE
jgi:hypothetical protein